MSALTLWFFIALQVPNGVLNEKERTQLQKTCVSNVHVSCIRMGIRWLREKKLSIGEQKYIQLFIARAYFGIDKESASTRHLQKFVHLDPCQKSLPKGFRILEDQFREIRKKVLKNDTGSPILSHKTPSLSKFSKDGLLKAQASDDLKVSKVVVFFRTKKANSYQELEMSESTLGHFRVIIPLSHRKDLARFEYYIQAHDCSSHRPSSSGRSSQPLSIVFQAESKIEGGGLGAGVLLGTGAAFFVVGALSFYTAFDYLGRWEGTRDLEEADELRGTIIFYHAIGWAGVGLGLAAIGTGGYWMYGKYSPPKKQSPTTKQSVDKKPLPDLTKPEDPDPFKNATRSSFTLHSESLF